MSLSCISFVLKNEVDRREEGREGGNKDKEAGKKKTTLGDLVALGTILFQSQHHTVRAQKRKVAPVSGGEAGRRQQGDPVWRCGPRCQDGLVDPDTPLSPALRPALLAVFRQH